MANSAIESAVLSVLADSSARDDLQPTTLPLLRSREEQASSVTRPLDRAPFRWTERERQTLPVRVEGQLPAWLQGDLVRTAPAVFERAFAKGGWQAEHWFDGLGLIYGFSFKDGVAFKQRLLGSRTAAEIERGRAKTASFGTDMQRGFLARLVQPIPKVTDNANVNIVPWEGQWLAMTETPHQHVVDPVDLGSRGLYEYRDKLPSSLSMSAHPHFDFEQKVLVNVGSSFGPKNELVVYRQREGSHVREVEGRLAFKRLPYLHDFGLSPRHAVLVDHPFTVNPLKLLFSNHGISEAFRWQPERGTRLWKLERSSGKWSEYLTEALFCFHTVNTFEDGDDVVLDFLAYEDASIVTRLSTARLAAEGLPTMTARFVRARLSPGKKHVQLEELSKQRFEFPNIAYRLQHGRRYDTAWGAALDQTAEHSAQSAIVRVDLQSGETTRFSEPGMTYGEPVFVPRPGAARPDDGVVLAVGSAADGPYSCLAVLDATRLEPLARCQVELSLPLGFHGNFQGR
ncbi:MAG: 15,15 beta carotene dioxygenase [Myxococcaceae bacterium]|nr:15,15 beta carotene dioxygenase [Myxococcaceae bacterium]